MKRIFVLCLIFPMLLLADWPEEEKKIEKLLQAIEKSGLQFERNGSLHTPAEAVHHLRNKLAKAQRSWFAPPKAKWTAELFIQEVASRSSLTNEPYFVVFPNGKKMLSQEWFQTELKKISEPVK